jgi:hypothetical protein
MAGQAADDGAMPSFRTRVRVLDIQCTTQLLADLLFESRE